MTQTLAPNSSLMRYVFKGFLKFFRDGIKQHHNMTSTSKSLLLWKCYTTITLRTCNSVTLLERLVPTFLAGNSCLMSPATDRVAVP